MRHTLQVQPSRALLGFGTLGWSLGILLILWQAPGLPTQLALALGWVIYGIYLFRVWHASQRLLGEYDEQGRFYPHDSPETTWQISRASRVADWALVLITEAPDPVQSSRRQYLLWRDSLPESEYRRLARLCRLQR